MFFTFVCPLLKRFVCLVREYVSAAEGFWLLMIEEDLVISRAPAE